MAVSTLGGLDSVAWLSNGHITVKASPQKRQVNTLMDLIDALTREVGYSWEKVDLIVADIGPQSLTGVRVGLSTCQGLSMPFTTPIWSCSHLEILAYQAFLQDTRMNEKAKKTTYLVAGDARMQQIAFASYQYHKDQGRMLSADPIKLVHVNDVSEFLSKEMHVGEVSFVGPGWDNYREKMPKVIRDLLERRSVVDNNTILAEVMVKMAEDCACHGVLHTVSATELKAIYLRPPV